MKHFPQCKRKATKSNFKQPKNARTHIAKTKMYGHWSRVTDTIPVRYIRLEWNWWSHMELMILSVVGSGFQLGQVRYN